MDEINIDPFADFIRRAEGHLTGAPIMNGRAVLLELLTLINDLNAENAFGCVKEVARLRGVDVSAAQNSIQAFDLLLPN